MPEMKQALKAAGLRQKDLSRLVEHITGQALPPVTVNRWCSGSRATPPIALAVVELWRRLPEPERLELLMAIKPPRRKVGDE